MTNPKEPQVVISGEDENLAQSFVVDDGRESSSSLLRECLAEFNLMHSQSPTHVLVDIDHMTQGRTKEKGGDTNEKEGEGEEEEGGRRDRGEGEGEGGRRKRREGGGE